MIHARFFNSDSETGFELTGHSDPDGEGEDILCAAVSSAAYLTANTVTEVLQAEGSVKAENGYMRLAATSSVEQARLLTDGLKLHLEQLSAQYPDRISVEAD
ncbi:MAG: ribosomal-processing cysteine protease Prp [Clostridia bacterium]|nr:ribosomal-processing cysteine protease Prp [Clostridia bacterium]